MDISDNGAIYSRAGKVKLVAKGFRHDGEFQGTEYYVAWELYSRPYAHPDDADPNDVNIVRRLTKLGDGYGHGLAWVEDGEPHSCPFKFNSPTFTVGPYFILAEAACAAYEEDRNPPRLGSR